MNQSGFPFETADQVFCAPAVVDLDQDGDNEIIFGDNSGMFYFLNHDMSIYNSYDIGDEIWGAPAIDDLNNNGHLEVAITCKNGMFYIFDHLGNVITDYDLEGYITAAPAIGFATYDQFNAEYKAVYVPMFESDGRIIQFSWSGIMNDFIFSGYTLEVGGKIQKGVALHNFSGDSDTDYLSLIHI